MCVCADQDRSTCSQWMDSAVVEACQRDLRLALTGSGRLTGWQRDDQVVCLSDWLPCQKHLTVQIHRRETHENACYSSAVSQCVKRCFWSHWVTLPSKPVSPCSILDNIGCSELSVCFCFPVFTACHSFTTDAPPISSVFHWKTIPFIIYGDWLCCGVVRCSRHTWGIL